MKLFTPSAALAIFVAAVMTKVAAFPAQINSRVFTAGFTLYGVDPNDQYFLGVPVDDNLHQITNPLSASKIEAVGGAICTFNGADGSETFIHDEETVDVGPPQPQVNVICDVA